jgi:hypothetical protein
MRNFSCAQVVCISSKTSAKQGGLQGLAENRLLTKKQQNGRQNVIFEVMSEVQKDLEDVSARIGKLLKKSDR